jgi:hypothetical protein
MAHLHLLQQESLQIVKYKQFFLFFLYPSNEGFIIIKTNINTKPQKNMNGTKQLIETGNKDFFGISDSFDLVVYVDSCRHSLSYKHRDLEDGLYIDLDSDGGICLCMGHNQTIQDRERFVSSEFPQKISNFHNLGSWNICDSDSDFNDISRSITFNNLPIIAGDCSWGDSSPSIHGGNRRGVDFQRMGGGEVEKLKFFNGNGNGNFITNFCNFPCRNGKVNFHFGKLCSFGNDIFSNKKEIFSSFKHGKRRMSFCMESVYFGGFDLR